MIINLVAYHNGWMEVFQSKFEAMYYYCFLVEPTPSHPLFWEIQGHKAHLFFLNKPMDGELRGRQYLELENWVVKSLADVRWIPQKRIPALGEPAVSILLRHGMYAEIVAYETGGGDEDYTKFFSK